MSLESRRGQRKSDLKPSLFQSISEPPSRTATQIQILNKLGRAQDQQDSQCPPGITILNALGSPGGSIRRSLAIPHFSGMLVDVSSTIPTRHLKSLKPASLSPQLACGGCLPAAGNTSECSGFTELSSSAHFHPETYHCFWIFPIWAKLYSFKKH